MAATSEHNTELHTARCRHEIASLTRSPPFGVKGGPSSTGRVNHVPATDFRCGIRFVAILITCFESAADANLHLQLSLLPLWYRLGWAIDPALS